MSKYALAVMGEQGPYLQSIEQEVAINTLNQPGRFIVLIPFMPELIGGPVFTSVVEYLVYPPKDEARNAEMVTVYLDWQMINYIVLSLPLDDFKLISIIAEKTHLELRHRVVPVLISDTVEPFPISGDNVYSLIPVADHVVHWMDQEELRAAYALDEKFTKQWTSRKWFALDTNRFITYPTPKKAPKAP